MRKLLSIALISLLLVACGAKEEQQAQQDTQDNSSKNTKEISLLNVSYDPTRELYQQYNQLFIAHWQKETGEKVSINQSHGGSGKQALSVIDGLEADVVSLALAADIDAIYKNKQYLKKDWQQSLPKNSTPYTSTIVFLVRKGNPKNIKDWDDLIRPGIEVITPNPKTSGGARWNFLAAWSYARKTANGDEQAALDYITKLYQNTPVLDTGARGSTISFTKRQLGDVLLAWENEAYLAIRGDNGDDYEIVTPSISILCEPPVAVIDSTVDKRGTRKQAEAYLQFLYTEEAQRIIAKNYYRPSDPKITEEFKQQFADVNLVNIDEEFGGWQEAQQRFFADGGVFDQIYQK